MHVVIRTRKKKREKRREKREEKIEDKRQKRDGKKILALLGGTASLQRPGSRTFAFLGEGGGALLPSSFFPPPSPLPFSLLPSPSVNVRVRVRVNVRVRVRVRVIFSTETGWGGNSASSGISCLNTRYFILSFR